MAEIMTVLGPIKPENLGITSMHEHVLYDGTVYRKRFLDILPPQDQLPVKPDDKVTIENRYYHRENFILSWDAVSMRDENVMMAEMADFKSSGGSGLLDMSVPGLRSDLSAIRRISEKTGVHVVAATGLYSEDSWPDQFKTMSIKEYESYMLGEINVGIENTGIKAGHIKAAIEEGPTEQGIKLLKAIARVSNETGLSVSIHHGIMMTLDEVREIMKILFKAGIDPQRTLMCHMQNSIACMDFKKLVQDPSSRKLNLEFNKEVMDNGFFAGHDCFGHDYQLAAYGWVGTSEWQNIAAIYELCQAGYAGQITLATDTYLKILTRRFGGGGYCHLTNSVLPLLEQVGVSQKHIQQMTVENPARLLTRYNLS
jgi:phosphotriesterase-related protein